MRTCRGYFLLLLSVALLAGCGGRHEAETIRSLRLSGAPDSARALAIAVLAERASQMDVWREFA